MSSPVIGFAGMTHLGINSAAAAAGHEFETVCFDEDAAVIEKLQSGTLPVMEPGLSELWEQNRQRLSYTNHVEDLRRCDVIYIAADVPTDDRGESDLSRIRTLIDTVSAGMGSATILVILCQVPPGFTRSLDVPKERCYYQVETLIFGRAVERAMYPERFIVGCCEPNKPLPRVLDTFLSAFDCPILAMRYESAELAKIAINCCLVASVTVANTLAELSEHIGADWSEIAPALKLDKRIGSHAYLAPGLGIAGGNLERDLRTVLRLAEDTGSEAGLILSFIRNSRSRRDWVLRTLHKEILRTNPTAIIGILGLSYKENTHSTKNSPSLELIGHLQSWHLRVYDPVVPASSLAHPDVTSCSSALDAALGVDVLVVMTPWPEFKTIRVTDIARVMKGKTIIDPHHVFSSDACIAAGLDFLTLGAPAERAADGLHA